MRLTFVVYTRIYRVRLIMTRVAGNRIIDKGVTFPPLYETFLVEMHIFRVIHESSS